MRIQARAVRRAGELLETFKAHGARTDQLKDGAVPKLTQAEAGSRRRHMTKGQRAMATAMLYPEPKRGRGNADPARKEADSASFRRVKEARFILRYAPAAAKAVLAGTLQFDPAYKDAQRRRDELEAEADAVAAKEARLARLRARYPELATKVVEGELTIEGAEAEANARSNGAAMSAYSPILRRAARSS